MTTDPLIEDLRRWGLATAARYARHHDGRGAGDNVLAKTFKVANGKKVDREIVKRDGTDRRRLMAARAGVQGLNIVPLWSCDPVRAANDASPPLDLEPVHVDPGVPDELRWVDRALSQMQRQHPLRARCVLEEFSGTGTQRMKAGRVQHDYGGKLSVWQYRREVERGVEWLRGSAQAA